MERWSFGFKSVGTRPLELEDRRRIARVRQRFLLRPVKFAIACGAWFLLILPILGHHVLLRNFEGWALAIWALGMFVAPLHAIRWVVDGIMRAHRLSRDLQNGVAEVLRAKGSDEGATDGSAAPVFEVLPVSAFALTINGAPNERWVISPVKSVAGPVHSVWSDFFKGHSEIDRTRERPTTEGERSELQRLIDERERFSKRYSLVMAMFTGILLATRECFHRSDTARNVVLAIAIVLATPPVLVGLWRLRLSRALRRDLESKVVVVVSFGRASQAKGAPESLERLPKSRRVWSINGAPAPWRILNYMERY
jgi:hypothetical protein